MIYKNTDNGFKPGRVCAATAAGLLAKVYATIGSASMSTGEQITVKTGAPFVMQNVFRQHSPRIKLPVTKAFLLKNITDWPTKLREM